MKPCAAHAGRVIGGIVSNQPVWRKRYRSDCALGQSGMRLQLRVSADGAGPRSIWRQCPAWLAGDTLSMCRSIKTLFNFEPPATEQEVRAASLQFVRKLSGFSVPSKANEEAFNHAVDQISLLAGELINSLVTTAAPRDRDDEAAKARERWQSRG
jgi:hypothetical protein